MAATNWNDFEAEEPQKTATDWSQFEKAADEPKPARGIMDRVTDFLTPAAPATSTNDIQAAQPVAAGRRGGTASEARLAISNQRPTMAADPRRLDAPMAKGETILDRAAPAYRQPSVDNAEFDSLSDLGQDKLKAKQLYERGRMSAPTLTEPPERGIFRQALDATIQRPEDRSVQGALLETVGDAVRGYAQGSDTFAGSLASAAQATATTLGLQGDVSNALGAASKAARGEAARLTNINDPESLTAKVFSSIAQNAPVLATLGFGNPALAAMWATSFGNDYGQSRDAGKSHEDSLPRAIYMATAEVIGEKVAMPSLGRAFATAQRTKSVKELGRLLEDVIIKDGVGEQVTTALGAAYEKFGEQGRKPGMTLQDYLGDVIETAKVSLGQSLIMGGVGVGRQVGRALRADDNARQFNDAFREDVNSTQLGSSAAQPPMQPTPVSAPDPYSRSARAQPTLQPTGAQPEPPRTYTDEATEAAGLAPIVVAPSAPAPVDVTTLPPLEAAPVSVDHETTLLEHANERDRQLTLAATGSKASSSLDEAGNTVTTPAVAKRFLTPAEKEEQAFLSEHGGDAPKLAARYPELVAPTAAPIAPAAPTTAPATTAEDSGDWQSFLPESGTLGIPRAEMPQVQAGHRGALVNFLAARDITHESVEMPAGDLKPTQAEFSIGKVEKAAAFQGGDRSILVSSDGYILDGHHQWLAKAADNLPVKVIRLDAPMAELLPLAREFPSSTVSTESAQTAPLAGRTTGIDAGTVDDFTQMQAEILGAETAAAQTSSVPAMPGTDGNGQAQATAVATAPIPRLADTTITNLATQLQTSRVSPVDKGGRAEVGLVLTPIKTSSPAHQVAELLGQAFGRQTYFFKVTAGQTRMRAANQTIENADGTTTGVMALNIDAPGAPAEYAVHEGYHGLDQDIKDRTQAAIFDGPDPLVSKQERAKFAADFSYPVEKQDEEVVAFLSQDAAHKLPFWQKLQAKVGDKDFSAIVGAITANLSKIISAFKGKPPTIFVRDVNAVHDLLTSAFAEQLKRNGYGQQTGASGVTEFSEQSDAASADAQLREAIKSWNSKPVIDGVPAIERARALRELTETLHNRDASTTDRVRVSIQFARQAREITARSSMPRGSLTAFAGTAAANEGGASPAAEAWKSGKGPYEARLSKGEWFAVDRHGEWGAKPFPSMAAAEASFPARPGGNEVRFSEQANDQTDTPEFKKWFGDAKVTQPNGRPLRLYHGTRRAPDGISAFKSSGTYYGADAGEGAPVWMTSDSGDASGYADWGPGAGNPTVYPLYAALRNPAKLRDLDRLGISGDPEMALYEEANIKAIRAAGFDGVMWTLAEYTESASDDAYNPTTVVAFDAKKIKSATGNNGNFDGEDGRIDYSEDGINTGPSTAQSASTDNKNAIIAGAKPGEFQWTYTASGKPPPFVVHPSAEPSLSAVGKALHKVFLSPGFKAIARDGFGIDNLEVAPLNGSWNGNPEPSFGLYAPGLTFVQSSDLSKLIGTFTTQDAMVVTEPVDEDKDNTPALYIGSDKKLTPKQLALVVKTAKELGVDYSTSIDGKAVKFLHFGDEAGLNELIANASHIAEVAGLSSPLAYKTRSQLNEAENYDKGGDPESAGQAWRQVGTAGPSDLFRRAVDHVLVPYAKAVAAEGYSFSIQRFGDRFGFGPDHLELIRAALAPRSGAAKSSAHISRMTNDQARTYLGIPLKNATVGEVLRGLQAESSKHGLIEAGDFSPRAMKVMAEAITAEVVYHVTEADGKDAIGWYDKELKAAKALYVDIFPEILTDPDQSLRFDAMLGIASQGNDVFSNSIHAGRMQVLLRNGKTIPEAVSLLSGSFGGETVAIENNYMKLDALIEQVGFARLREVMNTKQSVGAWNAILRADTSLQYKGKPLKMDGSARQLVSGWTVFGPKIGSFINNLHGDYTTLTADLWFSRSWNRIMGYSFLHAPALEANQYQNFIKALVAEVGYHNGTVSASDVKSYTNGGKPSYWSFGNDLVPATDAEIELSAGDSKAAKAMAINIKTKITVDEVEQAIGDPIKALELAQRLETGFKNGGYKVKSDLRRSGKVWIENRRNAVEAPRGDVERTFQQETAEMAQKMLKRKGMNITIADIQAAMWYYEKDLFAKLGNGSKTSAPASYKDAAAGLLAAVETKKLYFNKTDKVYVLDESANGIDYSEAYNSREDQAEQEPGNGQEDASKVGNATDYSEQDRDGGRRAGRSGSSDRQGLSQQPGSNEASTRSGALSKEELTPLPGAPAVRDAAGPDPRLVAVAKGYARSIGLTLNRQSSYAVIDTDRATRLAQAYGDMPHAPNDPKVKAAYADLIRQTTAQYQALEKAGYKFWFIDFDAPGNGDYVSSPWNAMRDIRANKSMGVFSTADGFGSGDVIRDNPLETTVTEYMWPSGSLGGPLRPVLANDLFRAVHDAFGHGLEGAGFRAQGEENAWQAHARLFTGPALAAITSETRGQNSYVNYGPNGDTNRDAKVEDTSFADQKVGLMPEWTWQEGSIDFSDAPIRQTETPKFKQWFKASKVRDAQGRPLLMYHGTSKSENGQAFTQFDTYASNYGLMGMGGYFTADPAVASSYTTKGRGDSATVYPVYLAIGNPIDMDAKADRAAWEAQFDGIGEYHEGGSTNESWYRAAEDMLGDQQIPKYEGAEAMQDGLRNMGFDGITHIGGGRAKSDSVKHRVFIAFDPNQIKSATGNNGEFDAENPDIRYSEQPISYSVQSGTSSWDMPADSRLTQFVQAVQDKHLDLKIASAAIRASGATMTDRTDAYLREELYHGRVAARTDAFAKRELLPLYNEMRAAGVSMEDLESFLHARHAKERNEAMEKINPNLVDNKALSGMSTADAATALAAARPILHRLAGRVDLMIEGTRDLMELSGLETADKVLALRMAYSNYVPLHRDDESDTNSKPPIGQGFSVKGSTLKRATGSTLEVTNILAHIALEREAVITRSEKNLVGMAIYSLAVQNPNPEFWTTDKVPKIKRIDDREFIREMSTGQMVRNPAYKTVVSMPDPSYKNDPTTLVVKVNGEDRVVIFNKRNEQAVRMVTSLKNLDMETMSGLMTAVGKGTRWLAAVNTQYNPVFSIVNAVRDIQGAALNLSSTPLAGKQAKVLSDAALALSGIWRAERDPLARGKWEDLWREYQLRGGKTGFRESFATPGERAEALARDIGKLDRSKPMAVIHGALEVLSVANDSIENATRLAAYASALDMGLSKDKSASIGKNLTVNFNRKGAKLQNITPMYAFLNAAVQGTARTIVTVKGPAGKKIIAGGLAVGMLQALMLLSMDDDDRENVTDDDLDRNLILHIGGGRVVKIPLVQGLSVLPSIGRRVAQGAMSLSRGDSVNWSGGAIGTVQALLAAFNPFGAGTLLDQLTPTVADPLVALATNATVFGSRISQLRGIGNEGAAGHTLKADSTNPAWGWVARGINAATGGDKYSRNTDLPAFFSPTPEQLRFIAETIGGGVWRETERLVDAGVAMLDPEGKVDETRLPFVSRFYGDTGTTIAPMSRYYDNLNELNRLKLQLKGWGEDEDGDGKVADIEAKHPESDAINSALRTQRKIMKLRDEKRELVIDGAPTSEMKSIDLEMSELMRDLNEEVRAAKHSK